MTRDAGRPRVPTVAAAVAALGWDAESWKGNCFAVAGALVDKGLVTGVAVYHSDAHSLGTDAVPRDKSWGPSAPDSVIQIDDTTIAPYDASV